MSQSTRVVGVVIAVAILASAGSGQSPATNTAADPGLIGQFLSAVSNSGTTVSSDKLSRAAVLAMAVAIDPGATLFDPADEAATNRADAAGGITRAEDWMPGRIAYVKFAGFDSRTGMDAVLRIKGLVTADSGGIILDLRGAKGCDSHAVGLICALFRNNGGELYHFEDLNGRTTDVSGCAAGMGIESPAAVLTDAGTSGSAELIASCLKGSPGVIIMGQPTAGDGRFREVMSLSDGFRLNIGLRRYVPWSGVQYDGCGVVPDIVVTPVPPVEKTVTADAASEDMSPEEDMDEDRGPGMKPEPGVAKLYAKAEGDVVIERALNALLCIKGVSGNQGKAAGR